MIALDQLSRIDHPYLSDGDECWCLSTYISGVGYRAGAVNQLIANFKCMPSIAELDSPRARYKERAIAAVAARLRDAVSQSWVESVTWIPVPPSRVRHDLDYDDRLMRVLRQAFASYDTDLRAALYQTESLTADHAGSRRSRPDSLYACLRINWDALLGRPLRDGLVLFDDVLTTGKHYKCCQRRLHQALPDMRISGLFIARRVLSGRGRRPP